MSLNPRTNNLLCSSPFEPPNGRLSLYIHVPFCERKCPYCAFESCVPSGCDIDMWLLALEKEIGWWNSRIGKPVLTTCYIGGGTPTVLDAMQWERLEKLIEKYFIFAPDTEVSVEANPNSLRVWHLKQWRDWRVTRVSIGVQSFDDAELGQLGRLHNAKQAYEAIYASLAAGFSVNADFMFGLPGQTFLNFGRTLRDAVMTGVQHISLYQLTIEKNTPWENIPEEKLSDGYAPYRWAQWYLPHKGYAQYEIANFAKPGHESIHNINYWRNGQYLGIGTGASGYIDGWRYKNISGLDNYIEIVNSGRSAFASGERLDRDSAAHEAAVLALRMADGIDIADYKYKYGEYALLDICSKLRMFPADLYDIGENRICLTQKGMRVANMIWSELI